MALTFSASIVAEPMSAPNDPAPSLGSVIRKPAPAKPRTALGYLGRGIDSAADQALAARYQFAVISLWPGMGATRLQANVAGIKAFNPNIKLAQYVILQEFSSTVDAADIRYPLWQSLNNNNWWLRNAAGNPVQWTPAYGAYNINVTSWAPVDANGKRWPQVKAKFDTDTLLTYMKGIDYVYLDGFDNPTVDADWKRIGTNQSRNDPEIASAFRKGSMDYVAALRSLNPTLKFIGNSGAASSGSAEYKGQLEGINRECLMGKSWSVETYSTWNAMMAEYRTALANTKAPNVVTFGACSPTADAALYRYGIASALLEDGYFLFAQNGFQLFPWFDESDAPLGTAAEAPPTAATPSGIWMRKYTNGVVLVNPSKTTSASIDLGTGYKHLNGTIDPAVNNGLPERVVTLPPRSGLMMVK